MINVPFLLWNLSIILESLPVSSSGHLKLIQELFPLPSIDSDIEHIQHLPNALVILLFLCFRTRCSLVTPSLTWSTSFIAAVLIANLITGITYLATKKLFQLPLFIGFFISGSLLLSLYYVPIGVISELSMLHGLLIGIAQTLALMPGISRMTMTVWTALWLGIDPTLGFMFSLVCELLLILVAAAVALYKKQSFADLWPRSSRQLVLLVISSILSYKALEVSLYGFKTDMVGYFGWYLLVVSVYSLIRKPIA